MILTAALIRREPVHRMRHRFPMMAQPLYGAAGFSSWQGVIMHEQLLKGRRWLSFAWKFLGPAQTSAGSCLLVSRRADRLGR